MEGTMKENTETISEIIFTHFPASHPRGNLTILLCNSLKKRILLFKEQLLGGAASVGIGILFLFAVYLFFTQLATYGWQ